MLMLDRVEFRPLSTWVSDAADLDESKRGLEDAIHPIQELAALIRAHLLVTEASENIFHDRIDKVAVWYTFNGPLLPLSEAVQGRWKELVEDYIQRGVRNVSAEDQTGKETRHVQALLNVRSFRGRLQLARSGYDRRVGATCGGCQVRIRVGVGGCV